MAQQTLTDKTLKALKPAPAGKRYEIFDAILTNMGVRVTDKGRISFFLASRFPGSTNPTRRSLGEYPAIELASARTKAREWIELLGKGIDPKVQIENERRQREAEEAQKRDRSFATLIAQYIAGRRRDGIRKADDDEMDFNREFVPAWKGRDVAGITMADILAIVEPIRDRGHPRQALNVAQKIGTFFNWCVDSELIEVSPFRPRRLRNALGEKQARTRVLSDPELRAFWRATATMGPVVRDVYRMLLLTGQRRNDIAQMSWREVDLEKRTLTVPARRFKGGRDHTIPLTDDAMAILEGSRRWVHSDWVFSLDGQHAVTVASKAKAKLDQAMLAEFRALTGDDKAEIAPWVVHDLRRTMRTRLSELDVLDEVAEAVIGHMPSKLSRTYNHSDRLRVKQGALARWEGALRGIVGSKQPDDDNVVLLEVRA